MEENIFVYTGQSALWTSVWIAKV